MNEIKKNKLLILSKDNNLSLKLIQKLQIVSNTEPIDNDQPTNLITQLNLNNKYYQFNLDVWMDTLSTKLNNDFLEQYSELFQFIDGFLFIFDKYKSNTFDEIKSWLPLIQSNKPNILIGCSLNLNDNNITEEVNTDEYFNWFIENNFEYFDIDSINDEESFKELYSSLQSHTWEGIELINNNKNINTNRNNPSISNILDKDLLDDHDQELPSKQEIENLHQTLFSKSSNLDDDMMGFDLSQAVHKIQNLREQAKDMSMEERRHLAATLALSIGLEMDQLSDLEDS